MTVLRLLNDIEKVQKVVKWVSHNLSEKKQNSALEHLYFSYGKVQKKNFLWKIVTGDEKWIFYDNPINKKQ